MSAPPFTHVADLAGQLDMPAKGTLSVTLHQDDHPHAIVAQTPCIMLLTMIRAAKVAAPASQQST